MAPVNVVDDLLLRVISHLDRMEALKRGGVSPLAHSVWTYVRTTIALLGETKHPSQDRPEEAASAPFHSNPAAVCSR